MAAERTSAWSRRAAALRAPSRSMGPEKWIEIDGINTRYFEQGTGQAVALFHGGNTGSATDVTHNKVWDMTLPPLSTQFRCIAPDRLGQGFTDNPKTDADYTMHASVQHAASFLKKLGLAPYHIVGHSRGAYLVCRLTLEYPELIKTCTLVSSGTLSPGMSNTQIFLGHPPRPVLTRESQRWMLQRYSYNSRIVTEDWLDEVVAVAETEKNAIAVRKMGAEGLAKSLYMPELRRQRTETHGWILARGMPCPTLVVWGLNDRTAALENGRLLIQMLMQKQKETEVRFLNKAGHFVYREQAESFNGLMLDYLNAHS